MRALSPLLAVLLIAAAARPDAPPPKLRILATVLPLMEFSAAVAGGRGEAALLLPVGAGVHNWQPRPGDVARLAECDLLLFIGSGLEPWLPGLLKALPPARLRTLEAAAGLAAVEPGEERGGEHDHGHESLDPHVWLDFAIDETIVDRIAAELGRVDPPGAIEYAANAARLKARLRALDEKFRTGLAGCEHRDLVLAGHGAFGYLARRYGLVQRPLYGLSPDAQPRPRDVMAAVEFCREVGVRSVFFENSVPADLARTLAREIGGRVLTLHSGHNLTREQLDRDVGFFDLMEENLAALRAGLACR